MRTAVMGAGSIGMFLGATITKNGGQIDLIDTFKENVDALNANGAKITGKADFIVPVRALTPDQIEGKYDLVFLCTKQVVNKEVVGYLLPHLSEDGFILTLQNGIPEPSLAEMIGRDKVAGGAVGFGATWVSPGVDMLTSPMEPTVANYAFDIGEIDGTITPRIQAAAEILGLCGGTTILPDLMGVRWAKVLMNATFSGMSAALGCTFGDVLNGDVSLQCVAHLADETIKVARADGIRLACLQGVDFQELELSGKEDIPRKYPFIHKVWDPHAALKASMLQDLEKKRKTEISYINGIVSERGKANGVPTPFNDMVCKIVLDEERTGTINTYDEAIKNFLPLL